MEELQHSGRMLSAHVLLGKGNFEEVDGAAGLICDPSCHTLTSELEKAAGIKEINGKVLQQ